MVNYINKIITIILLVGSSSIFAQNSSEQKIEKVRAHAGCSKCVYHSSKKCSLAIKIDNEIYEVEGSSLKDHGKPRGKYGLCKVEREVEISGEIKDGKFFAYNFELLPMQIDKLQLMDVDDS